MNVLAPTRLWKRWGWTAPAGLAALAAALMLAAGLIPRWTAETAAARDEAQRRRASLAQTARAARDAAAAPYAATASWPEAARAGDRVADLLEQSLRNGVTVQRSSQRLDVLPASAAQSLVVQQSAEGSYVDVRRLVAGALAADPALGLERIRLQRTNERAPVFSAELHWRLVQRTGPDPR